MFLNSTLYLSGIVFDEFMRLAGWILVHAKFILCYI